VIEKISWKGVGSYRSQMARRGNWRVDDQSCCVLKLGGMMFEI
jgi:hypothetical protein